MNRWGTRLLGFLVSAGYWPGMLSAVFVPRWAVIAVLVPLLWQINPANLKPKIAGILAFLIAAAAISIPLSPDKMGGVYELFFVLILAVTLIGASGLESIDGAMIGLGIGLIPSSVIVVMQMIGYSPVPQISHFPSGLFYNSEVLAEFAVLVLLWGLLRRNWWIAAASVISVAVCGSRISWAVLCASLIYASAPRSKWLLASAVGVLFIAAVATVFILGPGKMISADHRIVIWLATILAFEPFGNGLGWFQVAHPVEMFAHSDVLQMIAEIGLGAVVIIWLPIQALRGKDHVAERTVFFGVCMEAVVSFPLHLPATGFVAALTAGFLLSRRDMVRVGVDHGRVEDGYGLQRQVSIYGLPAGRIGFSRFALSIRSFFTGRTGQRLAEHQASGG